MEQSRAEPAQKNALKFTPMPFGRVQLVGDELADPDLTGVVADSSKDDGECTLAGRRDLGDD